MTERVEAIRRRHEEFIARYSPGPDWEPCNQMSLDRGWLLTALAQAERERAIQHTCTKCGYVTVTQYGEELRAEVERLKDNLRLREEANELLREINRAPSQIQTAVDSAVAPWKECYEANRADLARVRAALEDLVAATEALADSANLTVADRALDKARAALEGR